MASRTENVLPFQEGKHKAWGDPKKQEERFARHEVLPPLSTRSTHVHTSSMLVLRVKERDHKPSTSCTSTQSKTQTLQCQPSDMADRLGLFQMC